MILRLMNNCNNTKYTCFIAGATIGIFSDEKVITRVRGEKGRKTPTKGKKRKKNERNEIDVTTVIVSKEL